jgi:4-amino-4-deoxy-L-arabinose transferase-like glycosyltransferase
MKIFRARGAWYAAVLLCQALLSALTVPLAMQLGRRWLSWRWAMGVGILIAIWPHNIAIASNLLSETLFGFLCALAMLLTAYARDRGSAGWSIAAGLSFGTAALTNAILLPFGILLALYLAWRHLVPRRVWLSLCIASLLLPCAWAVRNHQLPPQASGHSSTDRALQNLVQGSWPAYHKAYALLAHGDQRGTPIFHAIDVEYQLLRRSPVAGARAILHRLGKHPLRYLVWYTIEKPWALWSWEIRVGQNDIYVYPAANSPFDTQPVMRALEALCHTINPLLAALALMCLIVSVARFMQHGRQAEQGGAALEAVLLLLVYVTLVYSTLQTDPRYSIPFRSFEMLLAMTSCSLLIGRIVRIRREHAK